MNSPSDIIISAQNLSRHVPALDKSGAEKSAAASLHILNGVNLEIKSGETIAILGASGSGKSTLLGLLAGLDLPSSGNITVAGSKLEELDEDGRADIRSQHVGFVFQSFQLLPNLTALENVMLPLELKADIKAEQQAHNLLQRVGLGERLYHYPRQLSGGEQQRVAIARAFVSCPTIVFADEPTGNLDQETGKQIIELLLEINQELHTTLVMVTHDEQLAAQCQRRLLLADGAIREDTK